MTNSEKQSKWSEKRAQYYVRAKVVSRNDTIGNKSDKKTVKKLECTRE